MRKTRTYYCARAKDADWSKINFSSEVFDLIKDFNLASLIDDARQPANVYGNRLDNKILTALKKRDKIPKDAIGIEKQYRNMSAEIASQIRITLTKAGYIRNDIDTYWLEQCQDLTSLCFCTNDKLYKEEALNSFLYRKVGHYDSFDILRALSAFGRVKRRINSYLYDVVYGTRKGYETFDPGSFERTYNVFFHYLSPVEKTFIKWWRDRPSDNIVLTNEEIDTLNCCFANFVINSQIIEEEINEILL